MNSPQYTSTATPSLDTKKWRCDGLWWRTI